MTEAIHQGSSVTAIADQIRAPWSATDRNASAMLTDDLGSELRSDVSIPESIRRTVPVTEQRFIIKQNVVSLKIDENKLEPLRVKSGFVKEDVASSSDDYLSDKAENFPPVSSSQKQGVVSGIHWKALNDSDEETSEGYDEMDEDTDEEDSNDKPGMSDTETKNLLDDAVDDEEESDVEDSNTLSSDMGRKQRQDKTSSESLADSLYGMSEEQKIYYTKCFNHLMKKTVGHYDINGAVHGANDCVVDFFKRSGLDREKLMKVWSLSDVNEDGYLDLNEFSTAMHLIVLHLKGNVPIPDVCPFEIRPPVLPRRDVTEAGFSQFEMSVAADSMRAWKQFDFDESPCTPAQGHHSTQYHSFSDDHLHVQPTKQEPPERLSTFSDVPPLLVDGRPTALKATQPLVCTVTAKSASPFVSPVVDEGERLTLSPQGPKGPPPKPPPRPSSKGHGRSASLDLNSFPICATALSQKHYLEALQRGATLPAQASFRYQPCNSMPTETNRFLANEWQDASPRHLPAPPVPPRATFVNASVQTEFTATGNSTRGSTDGHELIEFNLDMEKRIEELLAEEEKVGHSKGAAGQVNWKERCDHLRKLNAHLEAERMKLAQIRLQLELRLQEATGSQTSMKPTSL